MGPDAIASIPYEYERDHSGETRRGVVRVLRNNHPRMCATVYGRENIVHFSSDYPGVRHLQGNLEFLRNVRSKYRAGRRDADID